MYQYFTLAKYSVWPKSGLCYCCSILQGYSEIHQSYGCFKFLIDIKSVEIFCGKLSFMWTRNCYNVNGNSTNWSNIWPALQCMSHLICNVRSSL